MSEDSKTAANGKPAKPYSDFPLYAHASGRWAKRIRGKIHFFGRWGRKSGQQIVQVESVEASAASALAEFNLAWPYLSQGKTLPAGVNQASTATAGCTIADMCNSFLNEKTNLVTSGELSPHTFESYVSTCETIVRHFGAGRIVAELVPADFAGFRADLARRCNVVTILSKVNRSRVVFKYASDAELIERPVSFGQSFKRPKPKDLLAARNSRDPRMFQNNELRTMLDALTGKPVEVSGEATTVSPSPALRAMILLGLNAGFGNTDIATLPQSAVDLKAGWITFPRPKTGIQRRVPLWPETVLELTTAIAARPTPKDPADAGLCFITECGTRFLRVQESRTTADRTVTINAISRRFENLLKALRLNGNRGRNFYALRHVFETIAGECRDQVAVDAIMGHADSSMGANYRHGISDDRLRNAVEHVRLWLWPDLAKPAGKRATKKRPAK